MNSKENSQNSFFQEMDYLCIGGAVFLFLLILGYYDFRMHVGAVYNEGQTIYAALPRGMDYKEVYRYGAALWSGLGEFLKIPIAYPPLVTILFLPLTLFPVHVAYQLFVLLLMLCGAATVYISLAIQRQPLTVLSRMTLTLLICAILFFTYPFNFSFERGNSDMIAAVFAAGALLATARGKKWPAILLLTLSSQMKVYPAILSVFLLARFGWGSFASFIFLNIFYLFILGPNALLGFIKDATRLSTVAIFSWPGNHSFHSYLVNLCKAGFFSRYIAERILALAYFLSAASFIALSFKYIKSLPWRKNDKELQPRSFGSREIGLIGVSFCLMSLLPPTSHDYKLVIHIVPYIILLSTRKGELFENEIASRFFIAVVSAFTAYLYIPRFTVMPLQFLFNALPVMEMKTPALILLFLSYAYLAIRGHESDCKVLPSVSPPDPR